MCRICRVVASARRLFILRDSATIPQTSRAPEGASLSDRTRASVPPVATARPALSGREWHDLGASCPVRAHFPRQASVATPVRRGRAVEGMPLKGRLHFVPRINRRAHRRRAASFSVRRRPDPDDTVSGRPRRPDPPPTPPSPPRADEGPQGLCSSQADAHGLTSRPGRAGGSPLAEAIVLVRAVTRVPTCRPCW